MAGIIAARTLHQRGIEDFIIIEARPELGGRLMSTIFGNPSKGKIFVIETGANWIQGTQQGNGPANPIYQLARKHGLQSQFNDWFGSVCKFQLCLNFPTLLTFGSHNFQATFSATGAVDYLDVFNSSQGYYTSLTALAGLCLLSLLFCLMISEYVVLGSRVDQSLVDVSGRTGYSLVGAKASDPISSACEYYQFDWEYAQTPAASSLIASSWVFSDSLYIHKFMRLFFHLIFREITIRMMLIKVVSQLTIR